MRTKKLLKRDGRGGKRENAGRKSNWKNKDTVTIQHTRHRSVSNFLVNVIAGLIAYTHQDKKPSLNLTTEDLNSLQEVYLFPSEPLALTVF